MTEEISPKVWRIIDASVNRAGEGLRLLEDIARLVLDDVALTKQLKDIRHGLIPGGLSMHVQLLQARDATADVGIDTDVTGTEGEKNLASVVIANSRRVQESLRTLEELAKVPGIGLDPERFKQARFKLYTIEQELMSGLLRHDKD